VINLHRILYQTHVIRTQIHVLLKNDICNTAGYIAGIKTALHAEKLTGNNFTLW